jgi:hypothetical protein
MTLMVESRMRSQRLVLLLLIVGCAAGCDRGRKRKPASSATPAGASCDGVARDYGRALGDTFAKASGNTAKLDQVRRAAGDAAAAACQADAWPKTVLDCLGSASSSGRDACIESLPEAARTNLTQRVGDAIGDAQGSQ